MKAPRGTLAYLWGFPIAPLDGFQGRRLAGSTVMQSLICVAALLIVRGSAETISTAFSISSQQSSTRLSVTISSRSDITHADW